tara:strand:- start:170 stop:592 length:423 start_codon:yes stop_codon:yes gene_type:complete
MLPLNSKVYVYKNLHKDLWSVRNHQTGEKRLVLEYTENILLSTCVFHVSESGRKGVLREKRKNVHAGVIGLVQADVWDWDESHELATEITYDPYKNTSFVIKGTDEPVYTASIVAMLCNKLETRVIGFQLNKEPNHDSKS